MSFAELTAWARVEALEPDAVQRSLWEERTLVKTWAMRGTLHLLPADELPLWHAGLGTYRHYLKPAWSRAFGVTPDELKTLLDGVSAALDGKALTRQELGDAVATVTGSAKLGDKLRESWGSLLKPAAFRGLLCFGPNEGRNVSFVRPDQWVGEGPQPEADAALDEITRRFFTAHGPATREDYARWWAATPAEAGQRIKRLGDDIVEVDVEGDPMWMLAVDAAEAAAATAGRSVRLLPAFDQYVIAATKHARSLMPGDYADKVYRPQGWLTPVLAVDGRLEGVWRHERKGARLTVEIEPFGKVAAWAKKAAQEEADRLAVFLGGRLELVWR